MRFLLLGSTLTPAVAAALQRHEHTATLPAEISLDPSASSAKIVEAARTRQLDIITTDHALIDHIYTADLWFSRVIVYLQLPGQDIEQDDAIDRLFKRYKRLTPGRLYSVTESRVKIRQLPSKGKLSKPGNLIREIDEPE
ncbi:MAG TPA: hypothetical protein VFE58_18405 [Tepidisphaeraceae bacterium]|jgi:hypothetical protein|nr:hypothetical protein [Tepidisphaeraceae bacterium]